MDTLAMTQNSDEWIMARVGSLGASQIQDVIAKTKSGPSASRANVMARLITERLTGLPQESFQNAAMVHGIETEAEARSAYEFQYDVDVQQVGLVRHLTLSGTHASPDGLIGDDGLVEIKCPQSAAHIDTLLNGTIPAKYITQMQWQMACTARKWCDFVSYDPRMLGNMRLFVQRVQRDGVAIHEMEKAIIEFLRELDDKVAALTQKYAVAA